MKSLSTELIKIKTEKEAKDFIESLFTLEEIVELEKRMDIIKLLKKGEPQRKIAEKLKVGIATVSRGANELKKGRFKFLKT